MPTACWPGWPRSSAPIRCRCGTWLERLQLSAADRDRVARAAGAAPRVVTALRLREQRPPSQLARLLAGEPPETLALALALGAPPASILEWTRNLRHVRLEITGDDLVRAGVPESAAIGRALEGTLARKLDGEVSGREQELAAALEIAAVVSEPTPIEVELPGRPGRVLDPPRRRQRGAVRVAEPRASSPTTSRDRVMANRDRLAGVLGIEEVAMGIQVHGTRRWPRWDGPSTDLIEVDGHVTDRPGLALLVLTADCLPVALAAPGRVAMLHCGWRGIAGGIVARGVEAFDEPPVAVVGPGIGQDHFEVGEEVLEAFADVPGRRRRPHARPARRGGGPAARSRGARCAPRGPLHLRARRSVLLAPPRRWRDRPPGGARMADVRRTFTGLEVDAVRANLERVRERIGSDVAVLAAIKYVPAEELPVLAEAGIDLVGENRVQELVEKRADHAALFTWDFIGQLQSRKVKDVAPEVRLIHSVASESVLRKLEANPAPEVLVQVNVAGEEGKEGVAPAELGDFIARCPVPVTGLSTMPPFTEGRRGQPAPLRRAGRAGGPSTALSGCRWARPRTTGWPPRRARRSCGWGRRSTRKGSFALRRPYTRQRLGPGEERRDRLRQPRPLPGQR